MNRSALVLVDIQNDFMPTGHLPVRDGDAVIPIANALIEHLSVDTIVATQDWHPFDHGSFASNHAGAMIFSEGELDGLPQTFWPDHCVQDSMGAELAHGLMRRRIELVFRKGVDPKIDSYSGFFDNARRRSTGMAEWLRDQRVDTLYILGLATDVCVRATVLDALTLGFRVNVIEDGCRAVDLTPGDGVRAIEEMRSAGARITSSTRLLARRRIDELVALFPFLADKIIRQLMRHLSDEGVASFDEISAEASRRIGRAHVPRDTSDDNKEFTRRWDDDESRAVREVTIERAAEALSLDEIEDLVRLTRKLDEMKNLQQVLTMPTADFRLLSETLTRFAQIPQGQAGIPKWDSTGLRVALTRRLISDQLELIQVAKRSLRIRDFADLVPRMIGPGEGMGRIGGKAAGLILAYRVLEEARATDKDAPSTPIRLPDSFFLRSDVIEEFLDQNGLHELLSHKYKPIDMVRQEYPLVLQMFKNGRFSVAIVRQLRQLLEREGDSPMIVRSSSLLEDRFGASFAGKYRSVFLPNQGSLDERLDALVGAILEVYASIMGPDPITYRASRNLLDYDDAMGVLLQKVVGNRYGKYYFPLWAGVAFSRNEFRWSPRIKREDGLARVVFGMGTRAVDRVASDYPRMMALGMPTLRPVASDREIRRYSQRLVDVINLETNAFETIPITEALGSGYPSGLDQVFSIDQDGQITKPTSSRLDARSSSLVVTFDRMAQESPYPSLLRWILRTLEAEYGCPMDIEFAHDGRNFHLLQARPQAWHEEEVAVRVPRDIAEERKIFSASRNVTRGRVHELEFVVLIDPRDYDTLATPHERQEIATIVGQLNDRMKGRRFVLMGPGRWGSNDPRLGIKVGYAEICNTKLLIEIARAKGDQVPEVSFGTHFFQDLVESGIRHLALYPEEPGVVFNESFLHGARNVLAEWLPEASHQARIVRVLDVREASAGRLLNVDMDGDEQLALGYLS